MYVSNKAKPFFTSLTLLLTKQAAKLMCDQSSQPATHAVEGTADQTD